MREVEAVFAIGRAVALARGARSFALALTLSREREADFLRFAISAAPRTR
jgi:hypothetical protein